MGYFEWRKLVLAMAMLARGSVVFALPAGGLYDEIPESGHNAHEAVRQVAHECQIG